MKDFFGNDFRDSLQLGFLSLDFPNNGRIVSHLQSDNKVNFSYVPEHYF